jgi:hypothetical protein
MRYFFANACILKGTTTNRKGLERNFDIKAGKNKPVKWIIESRSPQCSRSGFRVVKKKAFKGVR